MAEDWTANEVVLIVADYFEMLENELRGLSYSKTDHRGRLAPRLTGRSKGSIEFKHANISAVLVSMGLPYIDGYKPRGNFQALLATSVEEYLAARPTFFDDVADGDRIDPKELPRVTGPTVLELFVAPPESMVVPLPTSEPWWSRKGRRVDFARRDAENRRLGKLGEQFVVQVERQRLLAAGREDLSTKVEWVADSYGDGLGFDVLSFDEDNESERFLEVKTTGLGKFFPFYVTANELRCSESEPDRFHLYRLFNFSTDAKLYVLRGALSKTCKLDAIQYRASF